MFYAKSVTKLGDLTVSNLWKEKFPVQPNTPWGPPPPPPPSLRVQDINTNQHKLKIYQPF
jgi:hypothetical protein